MALKITFLLQVCLLCSVSTMPTEETTFQTCDKCDRTNYFDIITNRIKLGLICAALVIGGALLGACLLPVLGFGLAGVAAGSCAACVQGPAVAAGSCFAVCQSLGATGRGIILCAFVGSIVGAVGAIGLVYKYRFDIGWCTCD